MNPTTNKIQIQLRQNQSAPGNLFAWNVAVGAANLFNTALSHASSIPSNLLGISKSVPLTKRELEQENLTPLEQWEIIQAEINKLEDQLSKIKDLKPKAQRNSEGHISDPRYLELKLSFTLGLISILEEISIFINKNFLNLDLSSMLQIINEHFRLGNIEEELQPIINSRTSKIVDCLTQNLKLDSSVTPELEKNLSNLLNILTNIARKHTPTKDTLCDSDKLLLDSLIRQGRQANFQDSMTGDEKNFLNALIQQVKKEILGSSALNPQENMNLDQFIAKLQARQRMHQLDFLFGSDQISCIVSQIQEAFQSNQTQSNPVNVVEDYVTDWFIFTVCVLSVSRSRSLTRAVNMPLTINFMKNNIQQSTPLRENLMELISTIAKMLPQGFDTLKFDNLTIEDFSDKMILSNKLEVIKNEVIACFQSRLQRIASFLSWDDHAVNQNAKRILFSLLRIYGSSLEFLKALETLDNQTKSLILVAISGVKTGEEKILENKSYSFQQKLDLISGRPAEMLSVNLLYQIYRELFSIKFDINFYKPLITFAKALSNFLQKNPSGPLLDPLKFIFESFESLYGSHFNALKSFYGPFNNAVVELQNERQNLVNNLQELQKRMA